MKARGVRNELAYETDEVVSGGRIRIIKNDVDAYACLEP